MAWHFVGDTLRDGRPVPKDGVWIKHKGDLVICEAGLHASRHPCDALQYAPGATLCRVECRGDVIEQDDKLVCRERRIVSRMDATEMLRYFARMQALAVIQTWETDPEDVVLDYLMTGDERLLSAAWRAAERDAWDAVWSVAWHAAASSAIDTHTRPVQLWSAAERDADSLAWHAVWSAARSDFEALVHECFGIEEVPA